MQMTGKHIAIVVGAAVLIILIMVWLFASPIWYKSANISIATLSDKAYENTVIPYYLDTSDDKYITSKYHYIKDFDNSVPAAEYVEVYIEIDLSKVSIVPFMSVYVVPEKIPEKYKPYVVRVTNAPLMTQKNKASNRGNLTFLILRGDLNDDQIYEIANSITYKVKWSLAMGIDGYIHLEGIE